MTELPSWYSRVSSDLQLVAVLVLATVLTLLVVDAPRAVDWLLGVPFLILYPGYALTSVLFPERPDEGSESTAGSASPGWTTRLAISLALSAVAVGVAGVLLSETVGIDLFTVVITVAGMTLAGIGLAVVRRRSRPPHLQADPLRDIRSLTAWPDFGTKRQSVALLVAVIALAAAMAFAGAAPAQGETFTEFYLLAENEDGSLVATDYPTSFVVGEGRPVHVAVENHEGRPMEYEVVVLAQMTGPGGTVTNQEEVDRFTLQVAPGERRVVERVIAPSSWAEGVRLQFFLYEGTAPSTPDAESADLTLHRWIDVVEA